MKKIKVAVFGSTGKMGHEIANLLILSKEMVPALGISRTGEKTVFAKASRALRSEDFKDIDVLIDFSTAEVFSQVLKFAVENQITLVSGTTGLSTKQKKELEYAGRKIPVLWAPNMSLGIAALAKAIESLKIISSFDFQIEEVHHKHKKDSPSGTAIFLQTELESAIQRKAPEILSVRAGGVYGEHEVRAYGENEIVTFSHRALSRKLFAEGALTAARWIANQKQGLFAMKDVFNK
jgi:4-hydroxy-tetrahydrodipicolinate reductase